MFRNLQVSFVYRFSPQKSDGRLRCSVLGLQKMCSANPYHLASKEGKLCSDGRFQHIPDACMYGLFIYMNGEKMPKFMGKWFGKYSHPMQLLGIKIENKEVCI